MKRRAAAFLLVAMLAAPFAAEAQQAGKVPRVGVLSPGKPPPDDAFRQREFFDAGLRELGWKPASTIFIDYRYAEGKLDRLRALAELDCCSSRDTVPICFDPRPFYNRRPVVELVLAVTGTRGLKRYEPEIYRRLMAVREWWNAGARAR
ncbi:MAG TPA: hypothetical protein VFR66_06190 [Burkholderiales bacterium]|nr:hypothetical protein [Burkholderiales bacterium]